MAGRSYRRAKAAAWLLAGLAFGSLWQACARSAADEGPAWVDRAAVERALRRDDTVVVDARLPFQYYLGHIQGAINIPVDGEDVSHLVSSTGLCAGSVIVYCSSSACPAAETLAHALLAVGCRDVAVYGGGWLEWSQAAADTGGAS